MTRKGSDPHHLLTTKFIIKINILSQNGVRVSPGGISPFLLGGEVKKSKNNLGAIRVCPSLTTSLFLYQII